MFRVKSRSSAAAEQFVRYALSIGAIELVPEGRTLRSGRSSPYFFNSGLFNTGESISNLAEAYVTVFEREFWPEVIFGPAYKGIPLAVAIAQKIGGNVGYAFNRKEAKDHGEGGIIVGAEVGGKKVLLADDVMTTSASASEAVRIVRANGGIPICCVIALDRQECGDGTRRSVVQEFEENFGVAVRAAATLDDLINVLKGHSMLDRLLAYREQYGAS
ncbi:orotate phosphoribosyltransferase [Candidatus Uhrbacteria bacterium]|nr:orotate phosphoribosyltransferase [Candidatus Uhrbacteria bacterium]